MDWKREPSVPPPLSGGRRPPPHTEAPHPVYEPAPPARAIPDRALPVERETAPVRGGAPSQAPATARRSAGAHLGSRGGAPESVPFARRPSRKDLRADRARYSRGTSRFVLPSKKPFRSKADSEHIPASRRA